MSSTSAAGAPRPWLLHEGWPVTAIAAVKLLLHLWTSRSYGYFVDELYYLACANHLAWGYVDQPPLIALITRLERVLLGDSLPAIRLLPVLAGVAKILLTGMLARELGGRRVAQTIAALCVLLAPGYLAIDNWLSMNAFEPLFWIGCAILIVRMIRTGRVQLWIWFGIIAGVGLQNKYSMAIFGFGLLAGLALTPQRRLLRTRWLWAGGAIALALFAPNIVWNAQHHFPFLELQTNIRASGRNVPLPPWTFLAQVSFAMLPLSAPIWLAGLWFFFRRPEGKPYRALGWAWLLTTAVIMAANPRIYYLFPAFPVLFAAGGVLCEAWLRSAVWLRWQWAAWTYAGLMVAFGAIAAPLAVPLLPVETYVRYAQAIHMHQPKIENHELGPLPQLFADQFGWEEMAASVARAYHELPPDVQARTAIFAQNYGQAGAIDLFGPKYGLPPAISGHQNYYLWGRHEYTGESMLVLDDRPERLEKLFAEVRWAAHVEHPYSMPYQHFDVFYCRGLKQPLGDLWPRLKRWE